LPDLGNFKVDEHTEYDRYKGVSEMMPLAKAVSAKSLNFDEQGNEMRIDYRRMMKIILEAGYRGYVGIEYSGDKLSEPEGIRATKRLLAKLEREFSQPRGRKRVMN
jgi:L-ribulose-5-phosphate 3-epimerase